jgi:hypothetical protein
MARAMGMRLTHCRTHSECNQGIERLLDSGAMPVAGISRGRYQPASALPHPRRPRVTARTRATPGAGRCPRCA